MRGWFLERHLQPMLARFSPAEDGAEHITRDAVAFVQDAGPRLGPHDHPPSPADQIATPCFREGWRPHAYCLPVPNDAPAGPALGGHLGQPEIFLGTDQRPTPQCQGIGLWPAAGIFNAPHCPEKLCQCLSRKAPGSARSLRFGVRPPASYADAHAGTVECGVCPRCAQAAHPRQRRRGPANGWCLFSRRDLACGWWSPDHRPRGGGSPTTGTAWSSLRRPGGMEAPGWIRPIAENGLTTFIQPQRVAECRPPPWSISTTTSFTHQSGRFQLADSHRAQLPPVDQNGRRHHHAFAFLEVAFVSRRRRGPSPPCGIDQGA